MDLLSEMPSGVNVNVYFDNFFTSLKLLDRLTAAGVRATGTVHLNRLGDSSLTSADVLQKKPCGTYNYKQDVTSGIVVVWWNDNNIVNIASNHIGVSPVTTARRWSSAKKSQVNITQPAAIAKYNRCMGGTDRMDQNLNLYRISVCSRKWWWALFAFCVDATVCNAWYLHRCGPKENRSQLSLLEFRRELATTYIMKYGSRQALGRPLGTTGRHRPLDARTPPDVRFDGINHHIDSITTQRRCVVCGMKTTKVCTKCNVSLHERCLGSFHTRL